MSKLLSQFITCLEALKNKTSEDVVDAIVGSAFDKYLTAEFFSERTLLRNKRKELGDDAFITIINGVEHGKILSDWKHDFADQQFKLAHNHMKAMFAMHGIELSPLKTFIAFMEARADLAEAGRRAMKTKKIA